jgi:serine/threonine protein phosphatase 1
MDPAPYAENGGAWNISNTPAERLAISDAVGALPLAIEVETAAGLVGIVHADCPFKSWQDFRSITSNKTLTNTQRKALRDAVLWSRERIEAGDQSGIEGVLAVFVGHTSVRAPGCLGNVIYVDTGAWTSDGGDFVLVDMETLAPATCRAEGVTS